MTMNPREFELIALEHVLARYRITGELPTINGQPFDINQFKQQIIAGVATGDTDINVNIDTVNNEIVDCQEHENASTNSTTDSETVESAISDVTPETTASTSDAPLTQPTDENKKSVAGKLFQFFNKG